MPGRDRANFSATFWASTIVNNATSRQERKENQTGQTYQQAIARRVDYL